MEKWMPPKCAGGDVDGAKSQGMGAGSAKQLQIVLPWLQVACERFFKQMFTLSPFLGFLEALGERRFEMGSTCRTAELLDLSWFLNKSLAELIKFLIQTRATPRLMFIFQAKIIGHYVPLLVPAAKWETIPQLMVLLWDRPQSYQESLHNLCESCIVTGRMFTQCIL